MTFLFFILGEKYIANNNSHKLLYNRKCLKTNLHVLLFQDVYHVEGFQQILQDTQAHLKVFKVFPDHHEYSFNDIKQLESQALAEGVKFVLLSEKDAVKLKGIKISLPFYKVVIDLEILEGREIFNKQITSTGLGIS